jgi:hypothetical protein
MLFACADEIIESRRYLLRRELTRMARNGLARAFLRSPLLRVKRTQRFRHFWSVHDPFEKSVSRNFAFYAADLTRT